MAIIPLSVYLLPPAVEHTILGLAATSDMLLVGEIHGTQEVPALVASLLSTLTPLGYRGLALEIPYHQANDTLRWATGQRAEPPTFFTRPSPDGRGNRQVLALIHQALHLPTPWQILCFDAGADQVSEQWTERDAWMAHNLITQWQTCDAAMKLIGICGNFHSRLQPDGPRGTEYWPSFAAHLQQRLPNKTITSVMVRFRAGAFFNMGVRQITPHEPQASSQAHVEPSTHHSLGLVLPHATPVTFLNPPVVPTGWNDP